MESFRKLTGKFFPGNLGKKYLLGNFAKVSNQITREKSLLGTLFFNEIGQLPTKTGKNNKFDHFFEILNTLKIIFVEMFSRSKGTPFIQIWNLTRYPEKNRSPGVG